MKMAIFHELDYGGARRTVMEFEKRLNKIFDVDLYYIDSKKDKNVKRISKKVFFYPFYPKIYRGNNWKIRLYKDTFELLKLYNLHKRIADDIKFKNYDYVLVNPSKFTQSPFILRFLKNKCIYYCQEPLRIVYDSYFSNISHIKFPKNLYEILIRKLRKWIDLENFRSALLVLANSNFSKEFIQRSYGRKAEVCYLGVDTKIFKPLNMDKSIDIFFIGNKDREFSLLKKSLRLFKTKPKLHTIFRESGQMIISDRKLIKIYNKSKVLVALNRNEPFGLIALEAMACGIPVIAIKEGGYKESIINNETGFLIERNPIKLYRTLNQLINDQKLRSKMSKAARENALLNWTWDKSVARFLEIIKYEK